MHLVSKDVDHETFVDQIIFYIMNNHYHLSV